jgi:hypothetical protein
MNELFQTEETLSPRLRWMRNNHITIVDDGVDGVPMNKRYRAKHGMASIATGRDEIDACINAAAALKSTWEGMP